MSLYLDTSCLLKMMFNEPESPRVAAIVAGENRVVVSRLAWIEASIQFDARLAGGTLRRGEVAKLAGRLAAILSTAPYDVVPVPPDVWDLTEAQISPVGGTVHCRTLDRLHLAIMQSLGLARILTNDGAQARAASALGYAVMTP